MDEETLRFCAKYPFTEEAGEEVLKDFNLDNLNDEFLEKTEHRIEAALKDSDDPKKHRRMIEDAWENTLIQEIVSYPLTKITAALSSDRYISRKVAGNEAAKTQHYLEMEDSKTGREIAQEILPIEETESQEKPYRISVKDYLDRKPRGDQYKLVNMPLKKGFVYPEKDDLNKLTSQHVYRSIIDAEAPDNPPKELERLSNEVKKYRSDTYTSEDYGAPEIKAFPPCMKKIYNNLQAGKEVGHQPRFVLATFMVNIGMSIEQMLKPYRGQPNFDEEKTRYYLRHAKGEEGGGTEYNAPSCDKIKSYGLCVQDCNTSHPLSYYKYRKKKMKEEEEE